jgi:L-lactate permease
MLKSFQVAGIGLPEAFVLSGIVVLGVYVLIAMPRSPKSGFRVRESDRVSKQNAMVELESEVAEFEKISASALPHQILGVAETASKREIQKAFRAAMKRFHPDRIGERGHEISQKLIAARDAMLLRHN